MKHRIWGVLASLVLLGVIVGCGGTSKPTLPEKQYTPPKPSDRPTPREPPPPAAK